MKRVIRWLIVIVGVGAVYAIVQHGTFLRDYWIVAQFTPSAEVQQSIERTKLTEHGVFLAEAAKAQFADASTFNESCRGQHESEGGGYTTLGCYIVPFGNIYAYRIENKSLEGIDDVVLVHEVLHAAWDRLSEEKRAELEKQLEEAYEKVRTKKFAERMEHYALTEPGERANELHSILPTEFTTLTPELEEYYSQYFSDRQAVVKLYLKYNKPFTDLQIKLEALEKKITKAEKYITKQNAVLEAAIQAHNGQLAQLKRDGTSIDLTSVAEVNAYNARVDAINTQASVLNQRSSELRAVYDEYIKNIKSYNAAGIALNELNAEIDSTSIQKVNSAE